MTVFDERFATLRYKKQLQRTKLEAENLRNSVQGPIAGVSSIGNVDEMGS